MSMRYNVCRTRMIVMRVEAYVCETRWCLIDNESQPRQASARKAGAKVLLRWQKMAKAVPFQSWANKAAESKRLRRSAQKIVTRWRLMAIAVPWHSWRASVDELRRCVPHSPAACHDALRQPFVHARACTRRTPSHAPGPWRSHDPRCGTRVNSCCCLLSRSPVRAGCVQATLDTGAHGAAHAQRRDLQGICELG